MLEPTLYAVRRFATLPALALALSMTACSGSTPPGPSSHDDPADPDPWSPEAIQVPFSIEVLRSGDLSEQSLHCAGPLHLVSEYEAYVDTFSVRSPVMWVDYYSLFSERFTPAERLASFQQHLSDYGGIPFLGIAYTRDEPDGTAVGLDAEVAAGEFDDQLRAIAKALADDGRPSFVRPGFEFNGAWNGYSPASYRQAFVRIRTLFLEEGASNAIWVWNAHPAGDVAPFMEFHPGEEHVDWWGINLFGRAFDSDEQEEFVSDFLAAARDQGAPIMIPESVPHKFHLLDEPGTWEAWFEPYFNLVRSEQIGAFCYSNRDYTKVPAWSDWGDLRIERSSLSDAWKEVLGEAWVVNGNS